MVCNICEIWLAFIGIHLVISWKCRNLQAQVALCALISPMAAPFANLYGVAKAWFQNDVIKTRFEDGGIGSIVMTGKNQAVVTKDQQHAVWNSEVLIPIMQNMAANHLIKAPDMPTIEAQVHTLLLLHQKKGFNAHDLPPIEDKYEVPIHLVATSIKKLICFCRNKFLKMHKPRDRVWVKKSCPSFWNDT